MTLTEMALRLLTISESIIDAIDRDDTTSFKASVLDFVKLKKEIRTSLGPEGEPIISFPDTKAEQARQVLNDIATGKPLNVEVLFREAGLGDLISDALTLEETDAIGSDIFYSWFSHHEYVEGLYEIGGLILAAGALPTNLKDLVQEARHCYAFRQYIAVFALSRTILEVALRDLCLKYGVLKQDQGNVKQMPTRFPSLYDMITDLCAEMPAFAVLRAELDDVRRQTNYIVHGNRVVTGSEAKKILQDIFHVVHRLYEISTKVNEGRA